jgi:hypothetical protein
MAKIQRHNGRMAIILLNQRSSESGWAFLAGDTATLLSPLSSLPEGTLELPRKLTFVVVSLWNR